MRRTQAIFYRDKSKREPVDEFLDRLPPKPATKIDDYIDEYLNGRAADAEPRVPPRAAGRDAPPITR
ncbi:MAG TPA: hypothetical protein VFJ65_02180 [Solirubrobacterales bacterium]|nr:hypothetical protein [Solirubrobacterales bacterium]